MWLKLRNESLYLGTSAALKTYTWYKCVCIRVELGLVHRLSHHHQQ